MVCDINNRFGDNSPSIHRSFRNVLSLEVVLAAICFLASFIFLVVSIFYAVRYLFLMIACLSVGIMITDDIPKGADENKASR